MTTSLYNPFSFFFLALLGSWIPGFIAAYCSYHKQLFHMQLICMIVGLISPAVIALIMIWGSPSLRTDFFMRLSVQNIPLNLLIFTIVLMPIVVLLATACSVLFGQPTSQFALAPDFKVMNGHALIGMTFLFIAPLIEELGWRGYGVDSLASCLNIFHTTLLFALFWALWHLPLFFINGYYQNQLWNMHIIYVINFFVSIFPLAFLMNWVYFSSGRNIWIIVIFHFIANLSACVLQTNQITKCIITTILAIVSIIVIMHHRKLFFDHAPLKENITARKKTWLTEKTALPGF